MYGKSKSVSTPDRAIRSLLHLEASASTARTLNLLAVWRRHGEADPDYRAYPFFQNPTLNRSIVVKHRLRPNEREVFTDGRSGATKIILPIDLNNLKVGARSFFVDQIGYRSVLEELFGASGHFGRDDDLLHLLDALPSLDPFLMRERLRKNGLAPARCYFDLTEADLSRMFEFARQEVMPLIAITFDDLDFVLKEKTSKLASKILANAADEDLEPLRQGMGIDKRAFEEGIFCWKGFIYYKWTLNSILPKITPISAELAAIRPGLGTSAEDRAFISAAQERLTRAVTEACETVFMTLSIYDDAYTDLTRNGQPKAFREFLLRAPTLFFELGERLGALQHIVSFWRFRFPEGSRMSIAGDELVDILLDFEFSLSNDSHAAAAA